MTSTTIARPILSGSGIPAAGPRQVSAISATGSGHGDDLS